MYKIQFKKVGETMEKRSETGKKKKAEYNRNYAKNNYKRVPLDISVEKYEQLKLIATDKGESVNGYIKKAIDFRIESGK